MSDHLGTNGTPSSKIVARATVHGSLPEELTVGNSDDERQQAGRESSAGAMVAMVFVELAFCAFAQCVQHLTYAQALEELVGPSALGVLVINGRSILLAIGRRLALAFAPERDAR